MKRNYSPIGSIIGLGSMILSFSASAVTLVNPGFEDDDASASPFFIRSASAPSGWTQFGDGADLIHDSYTQGPAVLVDPHSGSQFIDLNQAVTGGGLYQDVSVTSGQTYRLSFFASQWATNSSGSIVFSLIDADSMNVLNTNSFAVTGSGGWVEQVLEATATSENLRIQFASSGEFQAAAGLDTITLDQVPEPSSSLMILSSAALLFGRRKRLGNSGISS